MTGYLHFIEDDLYDLARDLTTDIALVMVKEIESYLAKRARFEELYGA